MSATPAPGNISPFFIVRNVPQAAEFYVKRLGFEMRYCEPYSEGEPFFAIVGRDQVQIFLKDVAAAPQPNPTTDCADSKYAMPTATCSSFGRTTGS